MKKTLKTLTAFLLLFALLSGTNPIPSPFNTDNEPGISVCGNDDEDGLDLNVIRNE